jgi:hypothetical protein
VYPRVVIADRDRPGAAAAKAKHFVPKGQKKPNGHISTGLRHVLRDSVGAIDGVHIHCVCASGEESKYRNRKGCVSMNVLGACNFDGYITYVLSGAEGSAHDGRVYRHAMSALVAQ